MLETKDKLQIIIVIIRELCMAGSHNLTVASVGFE